MTGKIAKRPLAFGMWEWPLTENLKITWDGRGEPLMFGSDRAQRRIRHPSASGRYDTVKQADAAVQAFYAAYLTAEAAEAAGTVKQADPAVQAAYAERAAAREEEER